MAVSALRRIACWRFTCCSTLSVILPENMSRLTRNFRPGWSLYGTFLRDKVTVKLDFREVRGREILQFFQPWRCSRAAIRPRHRFLACTTGLSGLSGTASRSGRFKISEKYREHFGFHPVSAISLRPANFFPRSFAMGNRISITKRALVRDVARKWIHKG